MMAPYSLFACVARMKAGVNGKRGERGQGLSFTVRIGCWHAVGMVMAVGLLGGERFPWAVVWLQQFESKNGVYRWT
jgi:hypothetical protein